LLLAKNAAKLMGRLYARNVRFHNAMLPSPMSYKHRQIAGIFASLAAALGGIFSPESGHLAAAEPGVIATEFIYETAPFPQCHASTICETPQGLVSAWFGGTREKNPDVGIWLSRHDGESWTAPVEVVNGVQDEKLRHPCWNPVLFQMRQGELLLFYKVGPSPSTWWGMLVRSTDGGKSWSKPERLPDEIAGPIKNKPVLLSDGRLLCPSSTEDKGWRVHMEWTSDGGKTWDRTEALNGGLTQRAIQPTIFRHGGEKLQMLCRNGLPTVILQSWSDDGGKTWTDLTPTELPHPGSGIDGVTLAGGQHLLVYNHTHKGRSPLNLAASSDGKTWQAALVLESEPGEYSYPAIIQSSDGLVHITYTWKRQRVRHVTVDPTKLALRPITEGKWPE
jgi:predicted neuraminidase